MPDFDQLLDQVGSFDKYQILIYFIICLPASLPSAWTAFNQVFVAAIPEHWCSIPAYVLDEFTNANETTIEHIKNLTIPKEMREGKWQFSRCFHYNWSEAYMHTGDRTVQKCTEWDYDTSTYTTTITSQFNLVCDQAFWPSLSTTVFYVGSFIGNILFGYVADRWGRRVSFFCIITVQVVFGTINAFAPDIITFTVLRFCVGLTFPALYQIPFIIGMELMGAEGRIFAGMVVCVFFGVSMCLLGVVASLIREWSTLTIICNTPFVLLFTYYWLLPESPRWLMIAKRYKEAHGILVKVAKVNSRPIDSNRLLEQCKEEAVREEADEGHKHRPNILNLFKTPSLRKKTLIITYIWFVNAVVYNGLTYNVSNLPVNDYLSFSINGAVEVPAYFIIWPLLNRVGRKWPLCVSMLLGGVACICTMLIPENYPWVISGLAFFGKFGIAASFAVLYIFAGELYPTVERAIGMGMSSMVAGGGLIIAPHMVQLGSYVRILPLLIMGTLTITAGIASMFLPETLGSFMPQTLEDAENFGKDFPFCYCPSRRKNGPRNHNHVKIDANETEQEMQDLILNKVPEL